MSLSSVSSSGNVHQNVMKPDSGQAAVITARPAANQQRTEVAECRPGGATPIWKSYSAVS
ncbi:hypothetical protein MWL60_14670 [Escherichia coli]|nr:hypothetical protein [Escherichia coli]